MNATFVLYPLFLAPEQANGLGLGAWLVIGLLACLAVWALFRYVWTAPSPAMAEPAYRAPAPVVAPDDLLIIEGIGPKIAAVLNSAGITTFNQLAALDLPRLKEILRNADMQLADPTTWGEQAALAARHDFEGLKALQDSLKGGRRS